MKTLILALGLTAAVSFSAAADSTSETNCGRTINGVYTCTSETETPDSFTSTICEHRGPNSKCQTTSRKQRIPEPSYEPVIVGGKTVTIMRGMPER